MRGADEIVKQVLQTEKGARIARHDQYLVRVATDANKIEIRQAVESLFNVKVTGVTTQINHGKWRRLSNHWGRRSDWKRAIVTLAKGQKIEVSSKP